MVIAYALHGFGQIGAYGCITDDFHGISPLKSTCTFYCTARDCALSGIEGACVIAFPMVAWGLVSGAVVFDRASGTRFFPGQRDWRGRFRCPLRADPCLEEESELVEKEEYIFCINPFGGTRPGVYTLDGSQDGL